MKKEEKTGFVKINGTRRKYDAPAPPKNVDWKPVLKTLYEWDTKKHSVFDVNGNDMYLLLPEGKADDDLTTLRDTRNSMREALEVIRPYVVSNDAITWKKNVAEVDLLERGIKLSSSFLIKTTGRKISSFGVRAFHVGFRYFIFVVLGGEYNNTKKKFVDPDNRPVVGYYITALSKEDAISNRCI